MTISFTDKIKDELKKISEFKEAVARVSSHLLELQKQRIEIYKLIIKNLRSQKEFEDMLFKDTHGHVKEFRRIIILELRYLNLVKNVFSGFKVSFNNLLSNAPDKFDNSVLSAVDDVFDDMISAIRQQMNNLVDNLTDQLESTHLPATIAFLSRIDFIGKKQRSKLVEKFKNFAKSITDESVSRSQLREEIQNKRRLLEKLMPEITKAIKSDRQIVVSGNSYRYEDISKKYADDADDGFRTISSSISSGSGISMPTFGGGGGSFGGGGASGSW